MAAKNKGPKSKKVLTEEEEINFWARNEVNRVRREAKALRKNHVLAYADEIVKLGDACEVEALSFKDNQELGTAVSNEMDMLTAVQTPTVSIGEKPTEIQSRASPPVQGIPAAGEVGVQKTALGIKFFERGTKEMGKTCHAVRVNRVNYLIHYPWGGIHGGEALVSGVKGGGVDFRACKGADRRDLAIVQLQLFTGDGI